MTSENPFESPETLPLGRVSFRKLAATAFYVGSVALLISAVLNLWNSSDIRDWIIANDAIHGSIVRFCTATACWCCAYGFSCRNRLLSVGGAITTLAGLVWVRMYD